ncbi:hypothetical protein RIF29_26392 [Crotalaria pallida]|uniref:Uncharacterized protein n=1 Tax=Crotalaria pallida TaxID=3830 RepID=A0AAN9EUY6_CROPI
MARKRGRPPKTPSSSNKKSQEKQSLKDDGNFCVDLSLSDEETLEEIDNLSPKKAEILLRNLETLRVRIEGKVQDKEKTDAVNVTQVEGDKRGSDQLKEVRKASEKQPSFWDKKHVKKQSVEKKRPTKEDVEKIDDALRAEDEEALETAVAVSNNVAAVNTPSKDTVVADSLSEPGEQDGGNSDAINRGESKILIIRLIRVEDSSS